MKEQNLGPKRGVDDGQVRRDRGRDRDKGVAKSSGACGGGDRGGTEEAEGLELLRSGVLGRRGVE